MTRSELATEARELAESLEAAVPLATTRIEHIRVSAHASRARRIAQYLSQAPEPGLDGQTGPAVVFSAPEARETF